VLVNGQAVKSCLIFAPQADGQDVTTVESLDQEDELHPLQQAFKDAHALQCGYCTPGFLMAAAAIAADGRNPSREELREELSGVICRCTGYENILTAVERYLEQRDGVEAFDG
jgi:carbon-monoxide dehydrogenase small subunit